MLQKLCQRPPQITTKWGLELAQQTKMIIEELWTHLFEDMFMVEFLQHLWLGEKYIWLENKRTWRPCATQDR